MADDSKEEMSPSVKVVDDNDDLMANEKVAESPQEGAIEQGEKRSFFKEVGYQSRIFWKGLTMTGGDYGATAQLFFDNLSTLLGALFAIQDMQGFGAPSDAVNEVVWGRIVPGVGLTLVLGNLYYSWQAIRLTDSCGRQYTAQPYGLNTPAAFAFVFNIMYPIYFMLVDSEGPSVAFETAYKVALAGNFITGLISLFLAFFGPWILQNVAPAALLVPIAGIGIAFLGLEQTSYSIAAPIVGYCAVAFVFIGWFSGVRIGYGRFRCPEALQVIIVGVILGWATGLNSPEVVKQAATSVKWWGPYWSARELFDGFTLVKNFMGIVIPIGISACATSLMCLVSAKNAGDPFPVRESMIIDGLGTMIASFFGSPFGTVLYIGHPAYKRSGAKVGYSLLNGCIYLILAWFGVLAVIQSIVNQATIGPIVLFVGLAVNEEALHFIPRRHYAAYIVGLFPSIYDWTVNVSGRSPLMDSTGQYNTNVAGLDNWYGVLAWKAGALLVSFVWVYMLVMVIDRKWLRAGYISFVGAILSAFGIIHVPEAGFKTFTQPTWTQCDANTQTCWEFGQQWMFMTAYLMLTVIYFLIEGARHFKLDSKLLPVIEDLKSDDFGDWFAEAYTVRDDDPTNNKELAQGDAVKVKDLKDDGDPDETNKTKHSTTAHDVDVGDRDVHTHVALEEVM